MSSSATVLEAPPAGEEAWAGLGSDSLPDAEWEAELAESKAATALTPWGRFFRVFGDGEPWSEPPDDQELLRRLADAEALVTQLMAQQSHDLLQLRRRRLAEQRAASPDAHETDSCTRGCCDEDGWMGLEVAQVLGVTERQVGERVDTATRLARFTRVHDALATGVLQAWTATKLLEHLAELASLVSPQELDRVEQTVLAWLTDRPRTVGQLNARMRRLLVRARSRAGQDQARRDARDRYVRVNPAHSDGLATLIARLPEHDALAVRSVLGALAADPVADDDERTREQRRCDLVTAMITGAAAVGGHAGDLDLVVRGLADLDVHVDVTIPADTLVGGSTPAEVPGYGPIPAGTGRDLAASARVHRPLVYDPATGHLLGLGQPGGTRTGSGTGSGSGTLPGQDGTARIRWLADLPPARGYEHPVTMERLVSLRDVTCRAPGCSRRAQACDCDHVRPWPVGPTSVDNTCCLCRRHHRLKTHAPGWSTTLDDGGRLVWSTPTGRTLTTDPHDYANDDSRSIIAAPAEPAHAGSDPPPF